MDAVEDIFRSVSQPYGRRSPTDTQLLMMRMLLNSIHAESRHRVYNSTAPNHLELDEDSAFTSIGIYVDRMERRLFENFPCMLLLEENIPVFDWAVYLFTQCSYTAQGAVNSALEIHSAGRRSREHWRNIRHEQRDHLRRVRALRPQTIYGADGALLTPVEHTPTVLQQPPQHWFELDPEWVDEAVEFVTRLLDNLETLQAFIRSRPRFQMREIMDDDDVPGREGVPEFLRGLWSEEVVPAIIREFTDRGERARQQTLPLALMVDGPDEIVPVPVGGARVPSPQLPAGDVPSAVPRVPEQMHTTEDESEGENETLAPSRSIHQGLIPSSSNNQMQSAILQNAPTEETPDAPQQHVQRSSRAQRPSAIPFPPPSDADHSIPRHRELQLPSSQTAASTPNEPTTDIPNPIHPPALASGTTIDAPSSFLLGSQALTSTGRRALADFCHHQLRAASDETREFTRIDWNAAAATLSATELSAEKFGKEERITEVAVRRLILLLRDVGRVEEGKVVFELGGRKEGFLEGLGSEGRAAFAKWVRLREEELGKWDGVLVLKG